MKFEPFTLPAATFLLATGLTSCGLEKASTHAEPTKFLKSTRAPLNQRVERLPFERSWRDPAVDITKYKNIIVRPVNTSYLRSEQWEESKSPLVANKRAYLRRCNALARYWNKSLGKAFSSPLCSYYKVTDDHQPGTLILEVALTEVRFSKSVPKAGEPPVPGEDVVSAVVGPPLCAFEARVRDASTGKLVSAASDRRGPEIKVLETKTSTLAKPNEAICDEWSQQLMQASNKDIFPKVRRSWFSLF